MHTHTDIHIYIYIYLPHLCCAGQALEAKLDAERTERAVPPAVPPAERAGADSAGPGRDGGGGTGQFLP